MNIQAAPTLKWYQSRGLWSFFFGFLAGGIIVGVTDYSALPTDKADAARQISSLQQSVTAFTQSADEMRNQIRDETNKNLQLQTQLDAARKDVDEAKSAKPDRYKIVKEGFRTWRLDSATGNMCLLLASETDWKDPKMAGQGCSAQ